MELTEEMLIKACREMKEKADKYPRQPEPIILHPKQYAEMRKHGWIVNGKIDYKKISEDIKRGALERTPPAERLTNE